MSVADAAVATPWVVRFNWFDVQLCAFVANAKTVSSLYRGRALEPGRDDLGFERDVQGTIGEYAVSVALDRAWRPDVRSLDTYRGDVGAIQVKTTLRPRGSMILRPYDPDSFPYVLAIVSGRRNGVGYAIEVRLVGWLDGVEAKVPGYWTPAGSPGAGHRDGYWVPQSDLRPMDEFPA